MKKLIILIVLLISLTGCVTVRKDGGNSNSKELKVGDYVDYENYVESKSYTTIGQKIGSRVSQTFKSNKTLKWVVISNDNGAITIAATSNTLDIKERGLGLNEENGYLNGGNILDDLCDSLYTTKKGNARSIKSLDVTPLIHKNSKKNNANKNEYKFTTGTFYDGNSFREATKDKPIKVRTDIDSYSFDKDVDLEEELFIESANDNNKQYWLSTYGVNLTLDKDNPNNNKAEYGMHYINGYNIGLKMTYSCDQNKCTSDQTSYLGVRPVVELFSDNSYTKTTKDGKTIWTIKK